MTSFCENTQPMNKVMDYMGVAKCEVKVEHEEKVRDGWVKLSRDGSGNLVQKFGKDEQNSYLANAELKDEMDKAKALILRHAKYDEYDTELYYKNYINSWDIVEESEIESSSEEDNDEEDVDELDDEFADY